MHACHSSWASTLLQWASTPCGLHACMSLTHATHATREPRSRSAYDRTRMQRMQHEAAAHVARAAGAPQAHTCMHGMHCSGGDAHHAEVMTLASQARERHIAAVPAWLSVTGDIGRPGRWFFTTVVAAPCSSACTYTSCALRYLHMPVL
jgi:hypothetical protein